MNISTDTMLAVAIGVVGYMVVFNLFTALAGGLFGVRIARIQFGYPPSVRIARLGETEIRVSPLLMGGHVKFASDDPEIPYASWPVRAVIAVAGPLLAIGVCAVPLGAQALHEALLAWPQMWAVVTDFSTPLNLDAALEPFFQSGGLAMAAALVATKVAMFNLLPLPLFNGGTFLLVLLEGLTRKDTYLKPPQGILWFSLLIMIAFPLLLLWRIVVGN